MQIKQRIFKYINMQVLYFLDEILNTFDISHTFSH